MAGREKRELRGSKRENAKGGGGEGRERKGREAETILTVSNHYN